MAVCLGAKETWVSFILTVWISVSLVLTPLRLYTALLLTTIWRAANTLLSDHADHRPTQLLDQPELPPKWLIPDPTEVRRMLDAQRRFERVAIGSEVNALYIRPGVHHEHVLHSPIQIVKSAPVYQVVQELVTYACIDHLRKLFLLYKAQPL